MPLNQDVIETIEANCQSYNARWIAVTKQRPIDTLKELYRQNIKVFGENKAQEFIEKYLQLPKDIKWHFIGHLQTNKIKLIIDKVSCIHSVDSLKLIDTIQKEANKIDCVIKIFIQIHIAQEETKYGFLPEEALGFFRQYNRNSYPNIEILGLMAMASLTDNREQIKREFEQVKDLLYRINSTCNLSLKELSMGMSSDYEIALECGATMLRIGSIIYSE